ncbi:fumarylacetoacetate hydrolase family protein [Faunimonas sp. B44]|uniref:fumarylacetoacetate hydrolase family protein n=1 Tax=Faunimonas sp. B44 TaxID=3461493 RepID=UPI0040441762
MADVLADARIAKGMAVQMDLRRSRLAGGERPIGWKAGFGAPAAIQKLGLDGPLIGFMTDRSVVASGATVSTSGWKKPVAEPEVAVTMAADLAGGADDAAVRAAIAGIAPAIELADLFEPPEDVEAILSGNIFHRFVILGACDRSRAGASLDGLTARVGRNGAEVASTREVEANTGRLVDVVRRTADTLAALGERLRAGDVVIAGSIVPPIFLERSDREVTCTLDPIGSVSVRIG